MNTTSTNNDTAESSDKLTFEHRFLEKLIYDSFKLETTLDKIYGADGWDLVPEHEHIVITVNSKTPVYLKEKLQIQGIIKLEEEVDLWVSLVHEAFPKK
ncbi:hypothetical protein FSARC_2657 [Fusarium sarcochroum]|uniref:Uncharacterized protein n=1 Tax=Fusarium sarcochroum TaxID=1208366 RepID=A0A8H4XDL3_9HYPO|nr:hypothetical protein FSARC_2657 [Fusarium sarcochroum]